MLLSCLSFLPLWCLLCLLAQSINAAAVTLEGDVISVDSAHNVFVNGVEVLAGSPTPTSTFSSHFIGSATATSPGYPASGIGDGVTGSTRGHTSGISNDVRSQIYPAATGEPDRSTRSFKQTDSPLSSDRFNVRSTASSNGNSADMVAASLSRVTQHTSTIDTSSQHSVVFSSSTLPTTSIGAAYSLGHDDGRTNSLPPSKVASQFSMTRTRDFATLTQDYDNSGLVSSVAATTDSTSSIRTSGGTVLDDSLRGSTVKHASSTTELFTTGSMDLRLESGHVSASSTSVLSSAPTGSAVPEGSFTRSVSLNSLTSGSKGFDGSLTLTSSTTSDGSPTSLKESRVGMASGTSFKNVPDTTLSSEATTPVLSLKSTTAATAFYHDWQQWRAHWFVESRRRWWSRRWRNCDLSWQC